MPLLCPILPASCSCSCSCSCFFLPGSRLVGEPAVLVGEVPTAQRRHSQHLIMDNSAQVTACSLQTSFIIDDDEHIRQSAMNTFPSIFRLAANQPQKWILHARPTVLLID